MPRIWSALDADHQVLWELAHASGALTCLMVSCCAGAKLQIVRAGHVAIREPYPDKGDLYERARLLRAER